MKAEGWSRSFYWADALRHFNGFGKLTGFNSRTGSAMWKRLRPETVGGTGCVPAILQFVTVTVKAYGRGMANLETQQRP